MTAKPFAPFDLAAHVFDLANAMNRAAAASLAQPPESAPVVPERIVRCPSCAGDGWVHGVGTDAQGYERYAICRKCEGSGCVLSDGSGPA